MAIKYSDLNNKVSKSDKTAVITVLRAQPPTADVERLIKTIYFVAKQNRATHYVFISDQQDTNKNPLPIEKKMNWLKKFFPRCTFVPLTDSPDHNQQLLQGATMCYNTGIRNLVVVTKQSRVPVFQNILKMYNNSDMFRFKSIKVISSGSGSIASSDVLDLATKPSIEDFKKWLPSTANVQDAKRLMNDIRIGLGVTKLIESFSLAIDPSRDRYYRGEIFNIGDLVEDKNHLQFKIVDRRTNYVLVEGTDKKQIKKWVWEIKESK